MPLSKPFIDDSADMCECPTNEKARMSGEQIVIISKVCVFRYPILFKRETGHGPSLY